jgi:ethanolamine utilization protein EutN
MMLGKVVGNVTSTRKHDTLKGYKFLVIQPRSGEGAGASVLVAIDLFGAGEGEEVIVVTGRAARMAAGREDLPVDAAVVGIVDPD